MVGAIAAPVSALGVLVADPCEHNRFVWRVVAAEQPVLLEELCLAAVFVVIDQGTALAVLGLCRIL